MILALAVVASLGGWLTPPLALALGLVYELGLGSPWPDASRRWSRRLLQASVVGLGFGMHLGAIWEAGRQGFLLTAATILGTLLAGYALGRWLKVEAQTSLLVSAGTSICGGSAIAALAAVLDADGRAMSVALATVFTLNALALFLFPPLGLWLGLDPQHFGMWAAIAIHDTSSVVGAAASYGGEALEVATTVKLTRALWIFPLALALAAYRRNQQHRAGFPWFILLFVAAAALRTLWPQPEAAYQFLRSLALDGLTLSLFFVGSLLSREALRSVGWRPLAQGLLLWLVISSAGLMAVRAMS